jgi:hypothetical protein
VNGVEWLLDTNFILGLLKSSRDLTPSELDLAPDAMYRHIKESGDWVLR